MAISAQHTQSLSDFRKKAAKTLDRLNETGSAEILTVNGHARAVLLSPAVYNDLAKETLAAHDASVINKAMGELVNGQSDEANTFFDGVRSQLLTMKAKKKKA